MLAEMYDIPYPCDVFRCPFEGVNAPNGMPFCQFNSTQAMIDCFKKYHSNCDELLSLLNKKYNHYKWLNYENK
jgi:hypothetical protein